MSDAGADGRPRWIRVLVAAVAGAVAVVLAALVVGQPGGGREARPGGTGADSMRSESPVAGADAAAAGRIAGAQALLGRRARALLADDRAGFLATVDPLASSFRHAQARTFDAIRLLPLASWRYRLEPADASAPVPERVRARAAADDVWVAVVTVEYALTGFDPGPARLVQALTLVRRGPAWLMAGDEDGGSVRTERALWDFGPVRAVRGQSSLVIGRGPTAALRALAREADAAVVRVSAVWGNGWSRRVVVLVPADRQELSALVDGWARIGDTAALATVETGRGGSRAPGGDRVLVNPSAFSRLDGLGRRVVMTHEVAHVATRAVTERGVPAWLAEGLADYIAFRDTAVPVRTAAAELAAALAAGSAPLALPEERGFDPGRADLPAAYQAAWLACRMIAARSGERALVRLYRAVGQAALVNREDAVDEALAAELRTTLAALTTDWRGYLARELR